MMFFHFFMFSKFFFQCVFFSKGCFFLLFAMLFLQCFFFFSVFFVRKFVFYLTKSREAGRRQVVCRQGLRLRQNPDW